MCGPVGHETPRIVTVTHAASMAMSMDPDPVWLDSGLTVSQTGRHLLDSMNLLMGDIADDSFTSVPATPSRVYSASPSERPTGRNFSFDNYESDLTNTPKDVFIARLVELARNSELEIGCVREDLFAWCKETRPDFPPGNLYGSERNHVNHRMKASQSSWHGIASPCTFS